MFLFTLQCLKYTENLMKQHGTYIFLAANTSGVIINTCGWIHGKGFECIKHASAAFEGQERHVELS